MVCAHPPPQRREVEPELERLRAVPRFYPLKGLDGLPSSDDSFLDNVDPKLLNELLVRYQVCHPITPPPPTPSL